MKNKKKKKHFLLQRMAILATTTSKEEFEEKLKVVWAPQPKEIQDEEAFSSSNYLQVVKMIATEY